ncbi:outer membrane protein [Bartonella sp. B41]
MKKCLITASVFAFFSSSVMHTTAGVFPQQSTSYVVSPAFSWEGFYFGGQISEFSGKLSGTARSTDIPLAPGPHAGNEEWIPIGKNQVPKLSGFLGGFYAGANIDLHSDWIFGVETDLFLFKQKSTKNLLIPGDEGEDNITFDHTFEQKWSGSTRLRAGFASNRIMPYISGGIAYGQFEDALSVSFAKKKDGPNLFACDKKTMIGYTLGGGVDFAMMDNVILRAEYRYSDFGKEKFNNEVELNYKTNDFRVGIAYKF